MLLLKVKISKVNINKFRVISVLAYLKVHLLLKYERNTVYKTNFVVYLMTLIVSHILKRLDNGV
jgi:hypothetical protein